MLSVEAGAKIYGRLQKLCHGNISIDSVISLSDQQIKSIGTSTAKVSYIRNLTTAIKDDVLDFSKLKELSDEEAIEQLISIRGIGSWSAKMFLIFALNRQDILPYEDVAFLQSFQWLYKTNSRSKEIVLKKSKKWKPYSSIAARYLYRALDEGLTKKPFHLFK